MRGGAKRSSTAMKLFKDAARAGLQSSSIMLIADVITQLLLEKRVLFKKDDDTNLTKYDPIRTLRWTTVGLTLHGPYFRYCFGHLDRVFGPAKSALVVAKKTVSAQLICFPPYLVALFLYMGLMEGSDNIWDKVCDRVPKAFLSGCIFWPIANGVNFAAVPPSARIVYLAGVSGLWNGYLSYMNAKKQE